MPAQQRFKADDAAVDQADFRLVAGADAVVAHDLARVVELAGAGARFVHHLAIEHVDAAAAAVFQFIQRGIGAFHQLRSVASVFGIDGAADAHAAMQRLAAVGDRRLQLQQKLVGDAENILLVFDIADHHGELVAAEAGDERMRIHAGAEPFTQDPQQMVARRVAQRVVHQLEVVKIQQHQPKRLFAVQGALHLLLQLFLE